MFSRHFLRSKVLQMLYAGRFSENGDIEALQNFNYHITRLNELGVVQVILLPKMVEVAVNVLEEGKKKFRPTADDRQPNLKIADNEFLRRMADNYDLKRYSEKWGGCWDAHEDILRESFIELRKQKFYKDYLSLQEQSFQRDMDFAINLFRFLMTRESLLAVVEERSLLWEDDFYQIAQYNFMMLKTLDEEHFTETMPWPLMYDERVEKDVEAMDFARHLLRSTMMHRMDAEQLIKRYLQGWEFERVSAMDITLVEMAVAELIACPTIPERVTVDEYIELSKEFSSERSRLFINGILDKIIIELRSQGKINKNGRGLASLGGVE